MVIILATLAFFRKKTSLPLSTLMRTLLTKDLEEDLLKLKEDNKNQVLTQFFLCYIYSFKILHTQYNINIISLISIHMSSPMNTYQRQDTFREEIISNNSKQYINIFFKWEFPFFRVVFFFQRSYFFTVTTNVDITVTFSGHLFVQRSSFFAQLLFLDSHFLTAVICSE